MTRLASRHRAPEASGVHDLDTGLDHLRFALARLGDGEEARVPGDASERLLVVLDAPAEIAVKAGEREFRLPPRGSVFDQAPSALYVPPDHPLVITGPVLAAIFAARADGIAPGKPYVIRPEDVETVVRGRDNFARAVRDILPAGRSATRLLAGETLNPPGNWSSSPPHKHDRHAPPDEAELEEIYLFRIDPSQGFGVQLSYTADPAAEEGLVVHDLDVVAIPGGYHPVAAAPGYRLYYLWCLAGRGRELHWHTDPAHAWVLD